MKPNDLSLKSPNDEQLKAIKHKGGVLLSAGAGSGKTFVLVEHIIHLFCDFCAENTSNSVEDFAIKLKDFFSQIVMMTFTKKAAGELSLRLQERFEIAYQRSLNLEEESISASLWEIANEQLDSIFVGTIHSFCFRLISQGLIPGFSGSEDMISDPELKNKLNDLFDIWIERNVNYLKEEELEHVLINKVFFRNHFLKVFSDTDLRVLWSKYKKNENEDISAEFESLVPLFCNSDWKEFLFDCEQYRPEEKKIPVWFNFLEHFSLETSGSTSFIDFCEKANKVFESLKRMPAAPRKKGFEEAKLVIGKLKTLRDFLKSYYPDLKASLYNKEQYDKNGELFLRIYNFLEREYFSIEGLTFTDLEFFVWKALANNKNACHEIQKNYNYFIVDEFQDTSSVQFDIVRSIVDEDLKKVFCVGDIKQAIYGFRGGELGVFKKTQDEIDKSLSLKNNYRSSEKVISLNNQLFDFLLPLGENYIGADRYSVPMLKQHVPDFKKETGAIEKISIEVSGELADEAKSLKPTALNLIESKEIAKKVSSEREKSFCILYRKLTPTRFLIPCLIEEKVGFTCQVKVQLDQDPILALFCEFTRLLSFKESKDEVELSWYVISNILNYLDCSLAPEEIRERLINIAEQESTLGLLESFKHFLWNIGLSSTNLQNPWPLVEVLCQLSLNKAEKAYEKINNYSDGNYSIDFRSGDESGRVVIMTAHSSKGLEFDHVILGGIHTNGVDKNDGDLLGKLPNSYKWFLGKRKTDVFRSPSYIREQEIKKRKSFAESKRLFYVASTRAVESIVWLDISFNGKPASFSKNSWINGIRQWESISLIEDLSLSENIKRSLKVIERSPGYYGLDSSRLDLVTPIYQRTSLGVQWSEGKTPKLGNSAELSVTRLASLEQCPRKFHLKNVLKLDGEDFIDENLLEKGHIQDSAEVLLNSGETNKGSSASRGTMVHETLEALVKENFILPRVLELDHQALDGIAWISELLKEKYFSGDFQFIAEEQIKFSIFGQMISGTPDLIIRPNDSGKSIEVWDYKTGNYSKEKAAPYWFQLYCYGLSQVSESQGRVKLVLAFIDDKKSIIEELSYQDLKDRIFLTWEKLSKPDEINQEHCKYCDFKGLCFPSS